jgi:3-hydroxyisobutyrate dehydrogenase-like beta-hydroxyacid dehydrogenase
MKDDDSNVIETADANVTAPVTVVGLGPMGQAIARTLLHAGHPVTVWNRTPARADALVAEGAQRADSVADALGRASVVLLSLTDYAAMYDILGPLVDGDPAALSGTTLVNLSSDTPARSREAAAWASRHGARFVTGGVMVPAPVVGTGDSYVFYSGPKASVDTHHQVLSRIGAVRWMGEDPGLAQLLYQAHLNVFLTALSGVLHSAALVQTAHVPLEPFLREALQTLVDTPDMVGGSAEVAREIESGERPGDLSSTTMMGATAEHILAASEAAGVDVALPRAVASHYRQAIAAGYGKDNWTSLFEVMKRPA